MVVEDDESDRWGGLLDMFIDTDDESDVTIPHRPSIPVEEEKVVVVNDDSYGRWAEMIPEILAMIFKRIPIPVDEMVRVVPLVCKGWMKVVVDSYGRWAEMIPEILAMIFKRIPIPVDEMVRVVPLVCKGWMKVVVGPSCWREIDISDWCLRRKYSYIVHKAVIKLVGWSGSTLKRLSAYRLGDRSFIFVASRGTCLTVLHIPMSNITDNVVLKCIKTLPNLKELDISRCSLLTAKGVEAFGNKCKSLVSLKRDMIPMQRERRGTEHFVINMNDDSETKAIGSTMQNLQHLELSYAPTPFGDVGLSAIIANCGRCLTVLKIPRSNITDNVVLNHVKSLPNLQELDISGCSLITVKGLEAFGNQCKSLVRLKRYMMPMLLKRSGTEHYVTDTTDDSEAIAIANTMSNLHHLELSYGPLGDVGLSEIIANCGRCLTALHIPLNNITDNVVLKYSKSLPNLKELDISGCSQLTAKGVEAFGNGGKSLVCLKRNAVPEMLSHTFEICPSWTINDSDAKSIANTMPNLQHLEICYSNISKVGLSEIRTKCKSLSFLDIKGCWLIPFERALPSVWETFIWATLIDSYYHY